MIDLLTGIGWVLLFALIYVVPIWLVCWLLLKWLNRQKAKK